MATMTAVQWPTQVVVIYHDDGSITRCEIDATMARKLRRLEWADQKHEQRREAARIKAGVGRESTFTDLRFDVSRWEGPRFRFELLLGLGHPWDGPDAQRVMVAGRRRCRYCGHLRRLSGGTYCLGCDRCGREAKIPRPTAAEMARPKVPTCDGLRGGTGA